MKTAFSFIAVCGTLLLQCLGQEQSQVHSNEGTPIGAKLPLVIPQPKMLRAGLGEFHMPHGAKWVLRAAARDERLWLAVQSAFAGKSGSFEKADQPWVTLVIGSSSRTNYPAGQTQPRWAADPEGYRLTVETNGLVILASTAQGAFYGLQTLAQLWQASPDERLCPALEIEDWPAMRFRGVHWFPSASGVPMHQKLIPNVFGALKFNRSVIQCEAARWDKHPEITAPQCHLQARTCASSSRPAVIATSNPSR